VAATAAGDPPAAARPRLVVITALITAVLVLVALARGTHWLPRQGRLVTVNVDSRALGRRMTVTVYLPPGYQASRRYPLLILLQGIPGDIDQLIGHASTAADALIGGGRIRPLLIAFPPGSTSTTDDATEWADGPLPDQGWFTFATVEAPAALNARFRLIDGASGLAIGGLSAGADAATNAFLANPARYAALLAWSGSFQQTPATVANSIALIRRFSAFTNATADLAAVRLAGHPIELVVGRDDAFLRVNRAMAALLRAGGVHLTYTETLSGHDWRTWDAGIAQGLRAADGVLAHETAAA
jgi:enterochelin esterase-like enzyme